MLKTILEMKKNFEIHITLNDKQQSQFDEWKSHIKALYGEYGLFTWTISYNGIGPVITVFSELAKVSLDLTDSDSW